MSKDIDTLVVNNNEAEEQFEAEVNGERAFIQYHRMGERIVFIHTEVPEALEGHGIASKLAREALEVARAQHLIVVPLCPFVTSYIRRHPEYGSLVAAEYRARVLEGQESG